MERAEPRGMWRLRRPRAITVDALLYASAAVVAGIAALTETIPVQRQWGKIAVAPYLAAMLVSAGLALWWRRQPSRERRWPRAALVAAVIVGAVVVPVASEVVLREAGPESVHVQSEVLVTEQSAIALVHGLDPYAVSYANTALGQWPSGVWLHVPYLPAIILFGLPRALFEQHLYSDARIYFVLTTLLAAAIALRLSRSSLTRRLWVLLVLIALPTGARFLTGGGDDVVVLALMLLAVLLHKRGRPLAGGIVLGVAAAIKQTAWPLVPYLVITARDRAGHSAWRRFLAGTAVVVVPLVTVFAAWSPGRFYQDIVLYPYGLAKQPTIAASPMLGRLLALAIPEAKAEIAVGLAAASLVVAAWLLVVRPPADTNGAVLRAGVVLTLLIALATAGRWGYLIYPANLFVWAALLLSPGAEPPPAEPAEEPARELVRTG